jgi:RNA polymerase sigma-70 factor (ECF subfamily)
MDRHGGEQLPEAQAMKEPEARGDRFARLMRLAQDGDRPSYEELLREIAPLIRQMIRRRESFPLPPQDVEDLVQDVLLSLHTARATYDPSRPFMPWIAAIVRNRVADGARRAVRLRGNEVAVDRLPETFSADETNRQEAFGDAATLRSAITSLPGGQRQAMELLKLREMSLKEASIVSGMTVGALKVAAHRGIRSLRAKLKRDMG